jgi:hypothetical protein
VSAESEGDVVAELGTNYNLEKDHNIGVSSVAMSSSRGMSYKNMGVHSFQVREVKYVQFILQLVKSLPIKWLCEYVG